ncbi:putative Mg(2+) transport ATPase [Klebsiella pneumoniae subsp. rhinoscleromatis]|nr:putative Mg(2+) transport ATPase [Klebsiella pneumoniae subsp. rhinoscleromatis]
MVFPYMTHLLAAMLLGALIGAERQWRQRMAGLRTNALVATGAAVFILSAMSASPDSPGAYCSADRLRYRLPWGRGDYA